MAPIDFPVGYKFHPRDEELVSYYLYNKVRGAPYKDENVIPEIDLYGSMEANDIWNNNGGQNLERDEDLYFFTKLKPASTGKAGKGSRVARTIGSGTWHGENSWTKVEDPKTKKTIGLWKRFQYRNTKYPQENGCWIMHEFRLDPKLVMHIKSNSRAGNDDEYVVCRIRKNYDRKRKADDCEETTRVVESQRQSSKIQKQLENSDVASMSSDVADHCYNQNQQQQQQQEQTIINATSISSIGMTTVDQPQYYYYEPQYSEVINRYDIWQQQEQTTLAEQQHYYVTQDPTVASSSLAIARPDNQQQQEQQVQSNVTDLPLYFYDAQDPMANMVWRYDVVAEAARLPQPNSVADPTMISSLGMASQEDYLQHTGFVNNMDMPHYHNYSTQQDPSCGTVCSQYDPPHTATTGFADQPQYFVTQNQPNYFVADPTMASSLASSSNLDQNKQVMNDKDQLTLLNFDYSQFFEVDGDDIMIDLEDLWSDMVQPAAAV